jgi:Protein of unknown function (DUF3014)
MRIKRVWWVILIVVVYGAAVLYFWLGSDKRRPRPPQPQSAPVEPAIRHPIEPATPPEEPLPSLAESDQAMREALAGLFGQRLEEFFNLQGIIHRFVATVDSLPQGSVAVKLMSVKPPAGKFVTAGKDESLTISPKNAARYRPYVELAEAVPTGPLVTVYFRFYPLFQQQYEELGYPGKYFNDRLVEVIDHLLAAPEVREPVRLTQPTVMYQFADPKLEKLSAGQKILVRIGAENAAKVKAKLREVRGAVASTEPKK